MATIFLTGFAARSQPRPEHSSTPEFELASIKPAEGPGRQVWPARSGGRISWRASIDQIVLYAYDLQPWQVTGLPPLGAVFQIDATTDPSATTEQIRLMLRSLLMKRFGLDVHYETRQAAGYSLKAGKGGIKLNQAKPGDPPPPLPPWFGGQDVMIPQIDGKIITSMWRKGVLAVTGRGVTIAELASELQKTLGTFVLDKTNVDGKYYFGISFLTIDAPPEADAPVLTEAVQGLGLLLEKEKGPVKGLLIDHIEKMPTAN